MLSSHKKIDVDIKPVDLKTYNHLYTKTARNINIFTKKPNSAQFFGAFINVITILTMRFTILFHNPKFKTLTSTIP